MKVICVHIEHFAAAAEITERPELKSRPIVIGGFSTDRKPVIECSTEAVESGVVPGMPLRQAHQLCPDAIFLPLDEDKYFRAFDNLLNRYHALTSPFHSTKWLFVKSGQTSRCLFLL